MRLGRFLPPNGSILGAREGRRMKWSALWKVLKVLLENADVVIAVVQQAKDKEDRKVASFADFSDRRKGDL